MEMDLNDFNIGRVIKNINLSIGDFANVIALKAFTSLVFKTPVGNPSLWSSKPPKGYAGGQARFSWNIKHKEPDTSLPKSWGGSMPAVPRLKSQGLEPVFVTSSIPYMQRLEEGWSTQGSHMVGRTMSEIRYEINSIG